MRRPKVFVTGASGFIGRAVVRKFSQAGWHVVAQVRSRKVSGADEVVQVHDWADFRSFGPLLDGVDLVVHLAANVHRTRRSEARNEARFSAVNTLASARLAEAAASLSVPRFLFVSSIAVNGPEPALPVSRHSPVRPHSAYAASKAAAETCLANILGDRLLVIRPPLTYGEGVPAKFRALLNTVARGYPLPLKGIRARRHYVALPTLVESLFRMGTSPIEGGVYMVSDLQALTLEELVIRIAEEMGRSPRLLPCPLPLQHLVKSTKLSAYFSPVFSDLLIDAENTWEAIRWKPTATVDAEIARTVRWFLNEGTRN